MKAIIDYNLIGHRIKQCRHDHHVTQEELATALHFSINHMSRIENGKVPTSLETLACIAQYFHIDLATLITGSSTLDRHYHLGHLNSIVEKASNKQLDTIYKIAKVILEE